MPPKKTLSGRPHPAPEAWHSPPQGRDYSGRQQTGALPSEGSGFKKDPGPMATQQQQHAREPHQQRLTPQRNSGTQV